MTTLIYCFRNDLRLHDNHAFAWACGNAQNVVPVCLRPELQTSMWGFERTGPRRRAFVDAAHDSLNQQLQALGSRLLCLQGSMASTLPELVQQTGAQAVVCEDIATPEKRDDVHALRNQGVAVHTFWQSSLFAYDALPWPVQQTPDIFTAFRQKLEAAGIKPVAPLPSPGFIPPLPKEVQSICECALEPLNEAPDPRSSFPFPDPAFAASEHAAHAHMRQYLQRGLPHSYFDTRNQLQGVDFSTKLSPWLACGVLSPRTVAAALAEFECEHGKTRSSYWIIFELLWRDHFRFMHLKYGNRLYHATGLSALPTPLHDAQAFERWAKGFTGQPLVDAGMRELAATGFLSNRMRQIVASYLVNDLACDWRAGAAWFESQLIDYDCYSNQGNWLYIAGRGTDPRGGRRFNPEKQERDHDPDGSYRRMWANG